MKLFVFTFYLKHLSCLIGRSYNSPCGMKFCTSRYLTKQKDDSLLTPKRHFSFSKDSTKYHYLYTNKLIRLINPGSSVHIMRESVGRHLGISWNKNDSMIKSLGVNAEKIAMGKAVLSL